MTPPHVSAPTIHPLIPERWPDLEALFGPRGACADCWDMWWRISRGEFERGKGLTVALLRAAIAHARPHGTHFVEGYPVEPKSGHLPDVFAWHGAAAACRAAGFREVACRSETRPIMRHALDEAQAP